MCIHFKISMLLLYEGYSKIELQILINRPELRHCESFKPEATDGMPFLQATVRTTLILNAKICDVT